jgi:nucleoside 2-deoxyribosyltransferase
MNTLKNNELFKIYLQECNAFDTNEEQIRERIKRKRSALIKKADIILILMIGVSLGIMTLWAIVQEIIIKLH